MNKKGVFSVTALIMGVITLICYAAMLPLINDIISDTLPYADAWVQLILEALPIIMLLMIVVGIIFYGQPEYQYQMR